MAEPKPVRCLSNEMISDDLPTVMLSRIHNLERGRVGETNGGDIRGAWKAWEVTATTAAIALNNLGVGPGRFNTGFSIKTGSNQDGHCHGVWLSILANLISRTQKWRL